MKVTITVKEGADMSLFDNKKLSTEQDVKVNLAHLAGGAAGAGLGYLASIPMTAHHENQLVQEGLKLTRDKEISEKNWNILVELKKGNITLEDMPISQRDFFAKQLEENAEDLDYLIKNPQELKRSMADLKGGKVQQLFGSETPKKGLFQRGGGGVDLRPSNVVPLFQDESKLLFPHKVQYPKTKALAPLLGLVGAYGAGHLATQHYMKENEELYREEDLKKFKEMMALANSSEE